MNEASRSCRVHHLEEIPQEEDIEQVPKVLGLGRARPRRIQRCG